ncbi:MAG: protein kinase, partial [Oscillospiraceae bacterium]|nr:protein kinase [Oscillospiraceae bacterium]
MDYYVGKILDGRYEIQEVLGVGGMAIVYRAYDNIDDRPVAVKILKEEYLANEEFRRRFKNESKAIAMLSHPNIVKVYDVSYGERLQYIVMEYVEGITLKEYIEQRRVIPWKEAVHFLTQILRALQHAHDRGVVHRDVKPQNVMLLHSGNIKVTDFGIARFTRSETRTMTENAIGSVHYISPEQARGDLTDGKSDIYSVGVVLYEMLTGELPFQSDNTVSVAIMQLQSEPRRPREVNDQIPLGLEQITIRAMQKSPADRYQSAAEMLLDLEEFKRNPLIRFEYNYYVDREPTKYVSPLERQRPARPAPAKRLPQEVR